MGAEPLGWAMRRVGCSKDRAVFAASPPLRADERLLLRPLFFGWASVLVSAFHGHNSWLGKQQPGGWCITPAKHGSN